jgi:cell division protein FtsQ
VSALRWGQGRVMAGADRRAASFSLDHFVLPRWLRRPMRTLARLGHGDVTMPRHAMAALSTVYLAGALGYGAWLGGDLDGFIQGVTARTGFAVDQIKVVGNTQTSEIDILGQLGLDGWTSLVGFDAEQARQRIDELPWVENAAVRKVYPHTLEIRVEERAPFAIWQQGDKLSVIERSGAIIAPYEGGKQAALPLIVGAGAPAKAPDFVAQVTRYPELATRVRGYMLVGDRRWDLKLDNGLLVKLPEEGADSALATLVQLEQKKGVFERDITSLDMRLSDRVVVELSPDAQKERLTALNDKPKLTKRKPGAKI